MFAWPHVFSVDDLSLPDPLSSPFHTARIYQSSISGELAAFHWGNIHFRHEPLYGNIVTVSAVIFLFGCPSCVNIIFNFMFTAWILNMFHVIQLQPRLGGRWTPPASSWRTSPARRLPASRRRTPTPAPPPRGPRMTPRRGGGRGHCELAPPPGTTS